MRDDSNSISEIRSAFDRPEHLAKLDIASFDMPTLRYFFDQVKYAASTWQREEHRVLVSRALERVPLLELLEHATTYEQDMSDVPGYRAHIVELFGFRRGLVHAMSIWPDKDESSHQAELVALHMKFGKPGDEPDRMYGRLEHMVRQWERDTGLSHYDLLMLARTGWGDLGELPAYIDAFMCFGSRHSGEFERHHTSSFNFETHPREKQDAAWREFITRYEVPAPPSFEPRDNMPFGAGMVLMYGMPPIFEEESDATEQENIQRFEEEARARDMTRLKETTTGKSRSLLGKLMDWWSR